MDAKSSSRWLRNAAIVLTIVIGRVVRRNVKEMVSSMSVSLVLPSCEGRLCWNFAPDETTVQRWERAEELTNERFGADLAALDPDELSEFCELASAAKAAAK